VGVAWPAAQRIKPIMQAITIKVPIYRFLVTGWGEPPKSITMEWKIAD
jgi:hypothetical protein